MAVKQGADAIIVENCAGILAGVAVRATGHGAGNALDGERGKRRGKRKLHFRLDYAEPPPIFYKYSER